jgi:ABC-type Fe3+/spermidine/putrescine transport system ATPase subunit
MDVGANVAYGLQTAGLGRAEQRDRTRAMLDLVGLAPYATRRVSELSGGQQQRVALARALVNEPAVLLLDEPLAALDLQLRKHLQEQLRSIHQRLGTTFIYVTHDQEEALKLSHRIALLCGGRLVQLGAPREIYERPASRFAAEFIGDSNLLEGVVEAVEPDRLLVRLPGGSRPVWLDWSGGPPPRPAEQVLTSVRPECVLPAGAGEAHMTGVVDDLVFVGAAQRYTVALPDRQLVMALAAGDADWPRGEIGLRVTRGVALPAGPAG